MFGVLVPTGGGDPIPLRKNEIIIGRKPHCDIVLGFSNVSSQHCKLVLASGYWYVLDLQSTNGVKVNGARVKDHRVDPNAVLSVSKHDFVLNYNPVQNGASGTPPSEVYHVGDVFSRSLLEKAGLQKPSSKPVWDETASTVPDMPAVVIAQPQKQEPVQKKNFFADLKFD
ncbi:MAG: FHA domain-containing protein [Planctomycetaceae bacterium]|jgi:adenylate cyclase|nr:FHA domain-containing protein [Planctomycetaceae bacterium]